MSRGPRGGAEAFDALARDRIDRLFAIASRILRDHHDAEDAVQVALWTAWSDLPGLREPARFDAWLYRLLIRACYRASHTRRRRAAIVTIVPDMHELPGTASADEISVGSSAYLWIDQPGFRGGDARPEQRVGRDPIRGGRHAVRRDRDDPEPDAIR